MVHKAGFSISQATSEKISSNMSYNVPTGR